MIVGLVAFAALGIIMILKMRTTQREISVGTQGPVRRAIQWSFSMILGGFALGVFGGAVDARPLTITGSILMLGAWIPLVVMVYRSRTGHSTDTPTHAAPDTEAASPDHRRDGADEP